MYPENKKNIAADPIQPYFVINSTKYYKKPSCHPAIAHFYRFTGKLQMANWITIPDGAIDIIFACDQAHPTARICGFVTGSGNSGFEDHKTYFGVRILPGYFDRIGFVSACELVNVEYNLEDVLGKKFPMEQIALEPEFSKQISLFMDHFINGFLLSEASLHTITASVLEKIYASAGNLRIQDLEKDMLYSRRHLCRCFKNTIGVDIKTFSEYVRFQFVLQYINKGAFSSLADVALAGNYYDQTHFQKDFKRFANVTPRDYLRLLTEYNYNKKLIII